MNHTRRGDNKPGLFAEVMSLLERCEPAFGQKRVFNRVLALVMAEIFSFGRHTVTQLLLTLGLIDEDWSAWYRLFSKERFEEEKVSGLLLKEMIAETSLGEPFVVGVDGVSVPRCSLKMPGSGWMCGLQTAKFKPGIQRGQRFVEGSWLPPMENGYSRAIPLRCVSAFTAKAVASEDGPRTEVEAGLSILHWTRRQLDETGRSGQMLMTLTDGGYATLPFWSGLPERTIGVVRTARNRCLYALMMLAGYRHWGHDPGAAPPGLWRSAPHRWSFNTLWRTLRTEIWQQPHFRATWTWSRDNWSVNEPLWHNLFNSVLASTRY